MNDKQASETKGLLLIDGAYNTLLIPFNSDEMKDLSEHLEKWLDEEFRPVFKKEGDDA